MTSAQSSQVIIEYAERFEDHIRLRDDSEDLIYQRYLANMIEPHIWKGLLYPGYFFKSHILDTLPTFNARSDDIIIASYPKSGTTWVCELVSLIKCNVNQEHVASSDISERVATLEAPPSQCIGEYDRLPAGRILQTHLPFNLLPASISNSKCKIIYVMRNPKDVAVSSFHHHKMAKDLGNYDGTFNDFLGLFMAGKIIIGSWFDHVKSYWEMNGSENILFVKFEDLKKDLTRMIDLLSEYLGVELTQKQKLEVLTHCSFANMKVNGRVNRNSYTIFDQTKGSFIRKGIVGDWKNFFDDNANHAFDAIYSKKLGLLKDLNLEFE